jgi:cytidine deaminase
MNVLSFGQNHYVCNSKTVTIHAEHDAINKLPYKRKKENINMLVLRFTKNYKLCMSKPCDQCINNMVNLFPKKGYIIKDIYYSNTEGNIEKTTLKKIIQTTKTL